MTGMEFSIIGPMTSRSLETEFKEKAKILSLIKEFFKAVNHFYLENSPFWEVDYSWEGFQWISNDDYTQSVISFRRIDKQGNEVVVVCNFQPMLREEYRIGVPFDGTYSEVFNTDNPQFGGSGITNGTHIVSDRIPMHGHEQSISLTLPPMSVMYFKCTRRREKRIAKTVSTAFGEEKTLVKKTEAALAKIALAKKAEEEAKKAEEEAKKKAAEEAKKAKKAEKEAKKAEKAAAKKKAED